MFRTLKLATHNHPVESGQIQLRPKTNFSTFEFLETFGRSRYRDWPGRAARRKRCSDRTLHFRSSHRAEGNRLHPQGVWDRHTPGRSAHRSRPKDGNLATESNVTGIRTPRIVWRGSAHECLSGPIAIVLDAKRNEPFCREIWSSEGLPRGVRIIEEVRLVTEGAQPFVERSDASDPSAGPEAKKNGPKRTDKPQHPLQCQ